MLQIGGMFGGVVFAGLLLSGCAGENAAPDETAETQAAEERWAIIADTLPDAAEPALETEQGKASFYADMLDLKRTASGEPLDQSKLVAAHRRFPFGTRLRVTNLDNNRSVVVRVIDRGPFGAPKKAEQRVIDLSRRAAERLGFLDEGHAMVRIDVIEYGAGATS